MDTRVTKELASYVVETSFEDFSKRAVDKAKTLILDSIGCMIGGCKTRLGQAILTPIRSMGGSEEATLVGGGQRVPTIQASFVNGTTANALDYDDTLARIGHPGATIISAALAVGEWKRASGKDLLNAVLLGYDISNRIARAIQPTPERYKKVWGVGTAQTFGAVVAAGKLLDLNLDQMLNAFGVAGATAPLPNTQKWGWDLEERPIHWVKEPTGWPSWTGVTAAILAANGFIGNRYILDGSNGFWIMAGSDRCDFEIMTKDLGSAYEVNNIVIKPYPSCRLQHGALDCVYDLKQEHNLKPENVKDVLIYSNSLLKRHEIYGPIDMVDAQFCIPYVVTMILFGYTPGPEWYTEENLKSEEILSLSRKVKVEIDSDMERALWEKRQSIARVELTTKRGEKLEKTIRIPRGNPMNPLSNQEIEDKFRNLVSYALKDDAIKTCIADIYELERSDDVADLLHSIAGSR